MRLSLKPDHLRRYRDIAALLVKYRRSDLVVSSAIPGADEPGEETSTAGDELARDLEDLGPTFIKVGQLLSTRGDILPPDALRALSRLQDEIEPFSFADVERIVQEELGVRISKAFARFDATPIAAASLGQVHRAALRDGREVAVKVQRPNVREQVVRDLESMAELADFLDHHSEIGRRYGFARMVNELRRSILLELDYRREAHNMVTIGRNLARFRRLQIPQPIEDLSATRVLTMNYIAGSKITKANPVVLADANAGELADELFRAYLHQVIIDGVFHADPHPGNVLLTDDGRIGLLDLGMVSVLAPELQDRLLHFLLAVADMHTDRAADLALQMGEHLDGYDESSFRRRIAQVIVDHQGATVGEVQTGRLMLEVARSSADAGVRLPNELTLLAKTLLNLDEIGRTLAPDFDVQASLRQNANELMIERMRRSLNSATAFSTLLEAKTFAERLPGRINRVLDSLANQELKLRVEMIDEGSLLDGLQKVANRITLGLLIAAAILGAALLMRVETSFRILGYPGLAMLFFLGAACGAVWLAVTIARNDEKTS